MMMHFTYNWCLKIEQRSWWYTWPVTLKRGSACCPGDRPGPEQRVIATTFLGDNFLGERIGQGNAWCTCTPNKNQNSTCSQYSMTRNILSKLLPTAISFILTMFSCSILEIRVSSMWKYRLWSHWLKPTQEEWRSPWGQTRASHPSPSPSSSSSGQQLLRTLCPGLCTQSHRYPHPPDR